MPEFIPEHTPKQVSDFVRGYLDCAEWLLDEEIDQLEVEGWSSEALARAEADCVAFNEMAAADVALFCAAYHPRGDYNVEECAGHDFFLTRNRHGTGFWDRGLGDLGKRLSRAAQSFGECYVYLGDDKKLHFE